MQVYNAQHNPQHEPMEYSSRWVCKDWVCIGHVDFMLVSISFVLGCQHDRNFWRNVGFSVYRRHLFQGRSMRKGHWGQNTPNACLRDWSLITGRGGGLQNGKIAGPKLFAPPPPPPQDRVTLFSPPPPPL